MPAVEPGKGSSGTARPVPYAERLDSLSERELLVRVRDHKDLAAREELITRYLPLVKSLARRFASRGQPVEDLVQVGFIQNVHIGDGLAGMKCTCTIAAGRL